MASKRPWYKWLTTLGGVVAGTGVFIFNVASSLPHDLVMGTYHGAAVTAGAVATVVGAVLTGAGIPLTVVGIGRKVENLNTPEGEKPAKETN